MLPSGEFGYNSVPADEERAYWDAYEAGKYAPANSENPYATSNAPHEGPGAASSRTVPLDAVVGGLGDDERKREV